MKVVFFLIIQLLNISLFAQKHIFVQYDVYHLADSMTQDLIDDGFQDIIILHNGIKGGMAPQFAEGTKDIVALHTAYILWEENEKNKIRKINSYSTYNTLSYTDNIALEYYKEYKEQINNETVLCEDNKCDIETHLGYQFKTIVLKNKSNEIRKTIISHDLDKYCCDEYLKNYSSKTFTWMMIIEEKLENLENSGQWIPDNFLLK